MNSTIFGHGSKDLFDNPLLQCDDDTLYFFAPAYFSATLELVLFSRLGRFAVRFEDKGKLFEDFVKCIFRDANIPARSFRYQFGGKRWECDLAALWQDTLFVFECKNYSLPHGHIPSVHRFMANLSEHALQATRIANHLNADRQIVQKHFGAAASWSRVATCVLHALPWNGGPIGEAFSYDASALGKFMRDGFVAIQTFTKAGGKTFIRRHRFSLWSGEQPSPDDLIRQLSKSAQLHLAMAEYEITTRTVVLSHSMSLEIADWTSKNLTLEEIFLAFGFDEERAQAISQEFLDFPNQIAQFFSK